MDSLWSTAPHFSLNEPLCVSVCKVEWGGGGFLSVSRPVMFDSACVKTHVCLQSRVSHSPADTDSCPHSAAFRHWLITFPGPWPNYSVQIFSWPQQLMLCQVAMHILHVAYFCVLFSKAWRKLQKYLKTILTKCYYMDFRNLQWHCLHIRWPPPVGSRQQS